MVNIQMKMSWKRHDNREKWFLDESLRSHEKEGCNLISTEQKHNSYSLKSEEDAIEDLIVRNNDQHVGCFNSLIILNN